MRLFTALFLILTAFPAAAGTPEAREVARLNNCQPKKIETFQSQMGPAGHTIYQVTCTLPKLSDAEAKPGTDALLIDCDGGLCTLMRPISLGQK